MTTPQKRAAVLAVVIILPVLLWLTRYRYDSTYGSRVLVRTNVWTGESDMLMGEKGWVPAHPTPTPRPSVSIWDR